MNECPRCQTQYEERPAFCGVCGCRMPSSEPEIDLTSGDPLIGLVIDGRYRIIDEVGRGGMGAVYRVEHTKMGKFLAMKLLHGELAQKADVVKRFKREAIAVSQLSHMNTVSVFDFGTDRGMMYLVMEYIEGRDLAETLRLEGPLSFERAAYMLIQVCSALIEAHEKGIVHRDLKPENIIVCQLQDQDDFVKVLDFGLAVLKESPSYKPTKITMQGTLLGTPYYMAPEYIRGKGVDARSDIYGLGAVLHKLLTGYPAFTAESPTAVLAKHLTEEVEAPSAKFPDLNIPEAADRLILKAMAKKPEERFPTARAMRRELVDALENIAPGTVFHRLAGRGGAGREEISVLLDLPKDDAIPVVRGVDKPSLVVGGREVTLGTRSDFHAFERTLRRKRVAMGITASILGVCGLALGVYYVFV